MLVTGIAFNEFSILSELHYCTSGRGKVDERRGRMTRYAI